MQNAKIGRRGQISWTWAYIVAGLGLLISTWLFIIMDQSRSIFGDRAIDLGVNSANMDTMNALWGVSPFFMLVGFGVFIWTTAAAARGGQL